MGHAQRRSGARSLTISDSEFHLITCHEAPRRDRLWRLNGPLCSSLEAKKVTCPDCDGNRGDKKSESENPEKRPNPTHILFSPCLPENHNCDGEEQPSSENTNLRWRERPPLKGAHHGERRCKYPRGNQWTDNDRPHSVSLPYVKFSRRGGFTRPSVGYGALIAAALAPSHQERREK